MFRSKSRQERAVEAARLQADALRAQAELLTGQATKQAASLKGKVGPSAAVAREKSAHAAEAAKGWAEPHVGAAKHWAAPKFEKAKERGVDVAAPRVEHAAESLAPIVDSARDRIVDDVLPRIVAAVAAATAAAAARADAARDSTQETLADVRKHAAQATTKSGTSHRARNVLLVFTVVSAGAGAGYAAWRANQPDDDPWAATTGTATPRPAGTEGGPTSRLSDVSAGAATTSTLGGGSLAGSTADVDTPVPDGLETPDTATPDTDDQSDAVAVDPLEGGTASDVLDGDGVADVPGTTTERPSGS